LDFGLKRGSNFEFYRETEFINTDQSGKIPSVKISEIQNPKSKIQNEKDYRLRKTDLNDLPQSGAVVS
jgi:hypothetical protein